MSNGTTCPRPSARWARISAGSVVGPEGLENRRACLLANHGVIATGGNLEEALLLAQDVETLAKQFAVARGLGEPNLLSDAEMKKVVSSYESYGQQDRVRGRGT